MIGRVEQLIDKKYSAPLFGIQVHFLSCIALLVTLRQSVYKAIGSEIIRWNDEINLGLLRIL